MKPSCRPFTSRVMAGAETPVCRECYRRYDGTVSCARASSTSCEAGPRRHNGDCRARAPGCRHAFRGPRASLRRIRAGIAEDGRTFQGPEP